MLYQQDWLMRQIEYYIQLLARFIFRRERVYYEIKNTSESALSDWLYREVFALLAEGKINEAENLIFHHLDQNKRDILVIAIEFYTRLNRYNEQELEKNNFSREEIQQGLIDVMKYYNLEHLLNL